MEGEGEGNLLGVVAVAGREEGYIWIRRKEEGEMMKGDQPHKWRHQDEDKKILPHLPLMLASSALLGVLGLLPVTLRSEKGEYTEKTCC